MTTAKTRSAAPTQKIAGVFVAGWLAVCVLYVLRVYARVDLPPEVAAAVTGLIAAGVGYLIPPAAGETVEQGNV